MEPTKARSEAGILVLVVFFLGVLLGAEGNHLWGARVWGEAPKTANMKRVPGQFMTEMTERLQLTPDQQKEFESMLDDTRARLAIIYDPVDQQRDRIRADERSRMRDILSPEQQKKFDDVLKELGPPPNKH